MLLRNIKHFKHKWDSYGHEGPFPGTHPNGGSFLGYKYLLHFFAFVVISNAGVRMLIQQAYAGIPTGPSPSESGIVCHSAYVELHHSSIERALSAKLAVKHKAMSYS